MKKTYPTRLIKSKQVYTLSEIAKLLNVHVRTAQGWRKDGLPIIPGSGNPFFVEGAELKKYLSNQVKKWRVKLNDGEFYCLACQKAVTALNVRHTPNKRTVGKGVVSIMLKGQCSHCGKTVNRCTSERVERLKDNKPAVQTADSNPLSDLPLFRQSMNKQN